MIDINIDELVAQATPAKAASSGRSGGSNKMTFSVIHHKCGKRAKCSVALLAALNNPKAVQFKYDIANRKIYIAEKFSDKDKSFFFSKGDNQLIAKRYR